MSCIKGYIGKFLADNFLHFYQNRNVSFFENNQTASLIEGEGEHELNFQRFFKANS